MRVNWIFRRAARTDVRRLPAGALLFMAVLVLGCSSGGDGGPPSTPDPTEDFEQLIATAGSAEGVLRTWVQEHLSQGFVPRCEDAQRPDDVGRQCARLHSERDGRIAYQLGPTFSELTRLFILELDNGVWTILVEEIYSGELTSIPWPLAVGADVLVAVDSECLQVRDQPGLAAVPIDCLDDGTPVTINAGPTDRDGLTWWRLAALGWVAGNWLRYPAE
ncbi:MAG: hypothetical protein IH865_01575 [Chloroflexi bacterium]|nr:hypothetical protein [Chloroflexota bacterium]